MTTFSALLGVVEVGTAVLIAVKPWWPRMSVAGSVMAVGLFLATLADALRAARVANDA